MPEAILTQRDKVAANAISTFNEQIPGIQLDIFKEILLFLKKIDTDKSGKIRTTSANIKAVAKFVNLDVRKTINKTEYEQAVGSFIGSFKPIAKLTDQYFTALAK